MAKTGGMRWLARRDEDRVSRGYAEGQAPVPRSGIESAKWAESKGIQRSSQAAQDGGNPAANFGNGTLAAR